jgi:phosphate transport system protein
VRQTFDRELYKLQREVVELGHTVDAALAEAVVTLTGQDVLQAQQVLTHARVLAARRAALETETLSLIATQQPVASDLRTLIALLEIITELEHLSNYAASIAQAAVNIGQQDILLEPFPRLISNMVKLSGEMFRQALLALAGYDLLLARAIPDQDEAVDQLYAEVCREIATAIRADPKAAIQVTVLNRVAHNLERTADRVINICEWIIFAITGEMKELNVSAG